MCHPVALAAAGAGQAILGHAAANQAASQRNRNRAKLYDADVARIESEHLRNVAGYYVKQVDAEYAWAENAIDASRAAEEQQVKINERMAKVLAETESDYMEMISDTRVAKSLERSGRTAQRASIAAKAITGRAKAGREATVDQQHDLAALMYDQIQRTKERNDRDAQRAIGFVPERGVLPPEPTWDKGPGMFSLISNVAIGAASGYMMGKGLQAPTGAASEIGSAANLRHVAMQKRMLTSAFVLSQFKTGNTQDTGSYLAGGSQ